MQFHILSKPSSCQSNSDALEKAEEKIADLEKRLEESKGGEAHQSKKTGTSDSAALREAEKKIALLEKQLEEEKSGRAKDQEMHEMTKKERSKSPKPRPKPKPKPSPRSGSGEDELKSPTRSGIKNSALQNKLFGSGAVPLPGVSPGVKLRKSAEGHEDSTANDPDVLPRLTPKFDRPKRDVRVPSREFRQSLVIEAEKSEFSLSDMRYADAFESQETNGDVSDGQQLFFRILLGCLLDRVRVCSCPHEIVD